MAIKIKSISEVIHDSGLKILIHGPAGSGKTVLAATTNEPTLIISAESGLLSLNQDKEELIKKGSKDFAPEHCSVIEISTIGELANIYESLLEMNSIKIELEEPEIEQNKADEPPINNTFKIALPPDSNVKAVIPEKEEPKMPNFKWIILDSITEIAEVVLAEELEKCKDGRKAYGELFNRMTKIMKRFRDLPNYHVVMIAKQQRIVDDITSLTFYLPAMPGNKLAYNIAYLFDEVFCLRLAKDDNGNPVHYIQATRDGQYEAKDRSGKLSQQEAPSLKAIHNKIYSGDKT